MEAFSSCVHSVMALFNLGLNLMLCIFVLFIRKSFIPTWTLHGGFLV